MRKFNCRVERMDCILYSYVMKKEIFRLYDIRGIYPKQINEKTVFDIGAKMAGVYKKNSKIVVGHDARLSSPSLYKSLCHGLEMAGFKVIQTGLITWPMLSFFVRRFKTEGGIEVTASHNPKKFNGLKFIDKSGMTLGGEDVFKKIQKTKINYKKGFDSKNVQPGGIHQSFADFLEKLIKSKEKTKIVIDCSNGAVGPIVKRIKLPKNITPIFLNTEPNGNFPAHGPDPTAKGAIKQAARAIAIKKANCGVVFDGDGDRAVFLDDKGEIIRPEYVWWLIYSSGEIIKTVANVTDEYLIKRLWKLDGSKPQIHYARVGHLFVRKASRVYKSDMTVESSAHYYFKEDNYSGCGMLATIKLLNSLDSLPYALSKFLALLPISYWLPEINKKYDRKKMSVLYKKIKKHFKAKKNSYEFLDGLSTFGKNWWFNVRPSNTEDLIRINIEGDNKKIISEIKKELLHLIK